MHTGSEGCPPWPAARPMMRARFGCRVFIVLRAWTAWSTWGYPVAQASCATVVWGDGMRQVGSHSASARIFWQDVFWSPCCLGRESQALPPPAGWTTVVLRVAGRVRRNSASAKTRHREHGVHLRRIRFFSGWPRPDVQCLHVVSGGTYSRRVVGSLLDPVCGPFVGCLGPRAMTWGAQFVTGSRTLWAACRHAFGRQTS